MSSKIQAISGYWVKMIARSLALATLAALFQSLESKAQIVPAIDGTGTQVRINDNQIQIYGGSLSSDEANLFHSLQQFGLTEGQIANFLANPNLNNIVTRITGGDPSVINGVLQVTGGDPNLFLMNPSGIIFGANAQLNLPASFAATTANGIQFGNQWFNATGANNYENLVGNPTAFHFDSNAGTIINAGNLAVNPQHSLLLLGGSVINTGQLSVPEGQVLVTAVPDRNVLHLQVPGNILTLEVKIPDELAAQPHAWTLPIAALPELLTSEAVNPESLGLTVTDAGDVQLAESNMQVPNQAGTAIASGAIDVSGDRGGSVGVFGSLVGVADARIDASGTFGGGTVLVGGEYRGQGTVPTAEQTYVDGNSTIAADALTSGDGGRVIVWADDATAFYGEITARGGANSGNGGFAEVSGQESLIFDGTADLSSVSGTSGTLLLDPENIFIRCSNPDPNICNNPATGDPNTITQETLESLSGNNNILLEASNDIIIQSLNQATDQNGTTIPILRFAQGSGDITFTAGNNFSMPTNAAMIAPGAVSTNTNSLNSDRTLTIQAGNDVTLGDISTRGGATPGGNVVIRAGGNVEVGDIATFADSGSGSLLDPSDPNYVPPNPYNAGSIDIRGINGNLPNSIDTSRGHLAAGAAQGSGADIYLEAEGNITTALIATSPVYGEDNTRAGNIEIRTVSGEIDLSRQAPSITNPFRTDEDGNLIPNLQGGLSAGFTAYTAGNVTITANERSVTVPDIGVGARVNGGAVNITSPEIIVAGNISSSNAPGNSRSIQSGDIQLNGNILLQGNSIIDTRTADSRQSGNIFIGGSINSNVGVSSPDLALDSGDGIIQVRGDIGSNGSLGALDLTARSIFISNNISATSVGFNASGDALSVEIGDKPISLNIDDLSLGNNARILGSGNNLTISPLTTNSITLGSFDSHGLDISSAEIESIDGFSNLIINAGNASITVNGSIALNNPTQLRTTVGDINVADTAAIDSQTNETNSLVFAAGTGNIAINGAIGSTQLLGDITLNSSGDFSLGNTALVTANSLNSNSQTANLSGTVTTTGAEGINLLTTRNLTITNLNTTGNTILASGGSASITNTTTNTGGFSATANTALTANNITNNGGGISLTSQNGDAQVNNLTSNGDVDITALGTITSTNGITSNGGSIALNSPVRIETDELVSSGGDINLSNSSNPTGSINVNGNINASSTVDGGDVEIISEAAIDLPNTNINTSGRTGIGGDITLRSIDGRIAVNDLTATGRTGGGNVSIIASELEDLAITLSIGEIDTSASIGNGGDVLLDPFGNIQVSFINAQGGTNGTGGDVTAITTGGLFRATDSFIDQNGVDASISAAGGAGEGSISIFHNGGDLFIPFFVAFDGIDVSAANASGTVGALTTGNPAVNEDNIIENRVFPGTFVQDRIGIFTSDRFTLALDNALPDAEPDDLQLENADQQPFWLDEYFTRRTEEYLGRGFDTDVKSLEEIQEDLRRIEEETGVKPALIYVVFEPEEVLQTIAEGGPGSPDDLVNQGWLQRFREMGSDRLQLVLVTSEGQPIFRRPDDPEAIRDNVPGVVETFRRRILDDLDEYIRTESGRRGRYLPHAQQLYAWLLEPLINDLEQNKIDNLVFIMDTGLRSTPLAVLPAMHDGQGFIIEKYSVGLMPSFSLTDTRYQNLANTGVKALAMGMDDFSQYDEWKNLNAVRDEIILITQQLWPSTEIDVQELLNEDFTLSNIYSERQEGSAGILHLATHTRFNPGEPQNSYIQLWDRRLSFSDLYDLGLNNPPIELLILSSCRTALSSKDESVELGFAGLSVQAGVKSSLASLWDVNDYGTLGLMAEFYSQLQNSAIKAEALQKAQLSMLREQVIVDQDVLTWSTGSAQLDNGISRRLVMSHPGFWSGFSIIGSPW